jgi:hypothetical protein
MNAPFKMNPGRGPMQKTGNGIPSALLQEDTYEKKLDSIKKVIDTKKQVAAENKKIAKQNQTQDSLRVVRQKEIQKQEFLKKKKSAQQNQVLDSLQMINEKGERAAAEFYANKERERHHNKANNTNLNKPGGLGLPEDASESLAMTNYLRTRKDKRY